MITILSDHDIEGQALLLWGAVAATGWIDILPVRLVRFGEIGLPFDSTDRQVWRFAQAHHMILLTNNRNMEGADSLEQTMRDEGTVESVPVITIARLDKMSERIYREACAERLLEIIVYLDDYMGVGRLFIP